MPTTTRPTVRTHIRWMIRRDMVEVRDIETDCFGFPWSEDDFLRALGRRNCIGMVAEYGDRVVGYMVYELEKDRLNVINFAVAPDYQRRRVGWAMADKLVGKLSSHRRTAITLVTRETNLRSQLFWKSVGFYAEAVRPGYYADSGEDGYAFAFRIA